MENTPVNNKSQAQITPFIVLGFFSIADWCLMFDCSEDTVKKNIKDFRVPVRRCGGTTIIDAEKWWKAVWGTEDSEE